jgi:hypothetical protein
MAGGLLPVSAADEARAQVRAFRVQANTAGGMLLR